MNGVSAERPAAALIALSLERLDPRHCRRDWPGSGLKDRMYPQQSCVGRRADHTPPSTLIGHGEEEGQRGTRCAWEVTTLRRQKGKYYYYYFYYYNKHYFIHSITKVMAKCIRRHQQHIN